MKEKVMMFNDVIVSDKQMTKKVQLFYSFIEICSIMNQLAWKGSSTNYN